MRELRIGLVGCGRLAERGYVPAIERARSVALVGVADVDPQRCRDVVPGVPAFANVADLLAGVELDAAVVATPPSTHLEISEQVASAGLPQLVEKPPADQLAEAVQLAALTPSPWIAFNRRFLRGLEDGGAGAVSGAAELVLELRYSRASWKPHAPPPDALLDAGSHLVDLARWLGKSEVRRVRTHALTYERAAIELDLGRGTAHVACAVDQPHYERVTARTERGELLLRYADGGAWRALRRRVRWPREDNPFVNSLARQLKALARVVHAGGETTLASALDGVAVMAAIEAARRSSTHGGWEPVRGAYEDSNP